MIIDSKAFMNPPPPTLAALPPHILLHVVYSTFPQTDSIDYVKIQRQRKMLLWLVNSLRFVNRSFYLACMHLLRSIYLPPYQSFIRPPYTSDPFPTATSSSRSPTYTTTPEVSKPQPIKSLQRETVILDRFIVLKIREDVLADDSELHLEREDMFKDLFDHAQPKARLEDLVRMYGLREGVINVPGDVQPDDVNLLGTQGTSDSEKVSPSESTATPAAPPAPSSSGPSSPPRSTTSRFFGMFSGSSKPRSGSTTPTPRPPPPQQVKINPIPFHRITISLSPRTVGLVVRTGATKRTLVEVQRNGRDETLEISARRLIGELKAHFLAAAQEARN